MACDIVHDGKPVARFIHGQGQMKPYLHVFGESGELLTNGGLDKEGKPSGEFPHHRGIFIGWKVISELGTDDLWHMTRGCKMEVTKLEKSENSAGATLAAEILWRSARETNGSDVLIRETRRLVISRSAEKQTQIDASFVLKPERDLQLAGDLQHSGVHFRAANEVHTREKETSYLTEPEKDVKSNDLEWCRLLFPIGEKWYSALQLNAPTNPVEELSMRNYGRFGYFFKKDLKKRAPLELRYRFVVGESESPSEAGKPAPEQRAKWREDAQKLYDTFAAAR